MSRSCQHAQAGRATHITRARTVHLDAPRGDKLGQLRESGGRGVRPLKIRYAVVHRPREVRSVRLLKCVPHFFAYGPLPCTGGGGHGGGSLVARRRVLGQALSVEGGGVKGGRVARRGGSPCVSLGGIKGGQVAPRSGSSRAPHSGSRRKTWCCQRGAAEPAPAEHCDARVAALQPALRSTHAWQHRRCRRRSV